jgi:uncharacterized BrkB/YihY/UPF0761 family membrane protein
VKDLEHHALVQAPVDPVDEDGVAAAYVGTAISALATALLWWQHGWLDAHGQGWWLWVAVSATVSGMLFSTYTRYRTRKRRSLPSPSVEQ